VLLRCFFLCPALLVSACAIGDDGINPRDGDGSVDSAIPLECVPVCDIGQTCVGGTCVDEGTDGDGDGIVASRDCDDADAAIGGTAEELCTEACGEGLRRCTDGVWAECDAPLTCQCTPGSAPREMPCGMCGTQTQECVDGMWTTDAACIGQGECNAGAVEDLGSCGNCGTSERRCAADCSWGEPLCVGLGECAAGATETGMQGCGTCGGGTQSRTRTCSAACSWGTWGAWGTCSGGGGMCTAGQTDMESRPCGNCNLGTQTRTRTCNATTCDWNTFGPWSTCVGGGACAPGQTRTGCDMNSTGAATPCGVNTCTSSCTWGTACTVAPGASCLSERGTNYQCCTASGGVPGWQFCSASTCNWNPCVAHSCS
jgi:hypothetical protein